MQKLYPADLITGRSGFVKVRVIGDYNYLYRKCVILKEYLDQLTFVQAKNSEPNAIRRQIRIKKGLRCWCCGIIVDEEQYYKRKVEGLKRTIRAEVSRQKNQNTGFGFLVFSDEKIVKDYKHLGLPHFHQ